MPARLINEIKLGKHGYQLWEEDEERLPRSRHDIEPDTEAYFTWLAGLPSFRFKGREGHFTARKETRQRGEMYWYAYRRQGRQFSIYLGTTDKLTIARLEHIAGALAALCRTQEKKKTPRKRPEKREVLYARVKMRDEALEQKDKTIEQLRAENQALRDEIQALKVKEARRIHMGTQRPLPDLP